MLITLLDTAKLRRVVPSTGDKGKTWTSVYPHTAQLTHGCLLGLPPTALGVRVSVRVWAWVRVSCVLRALPQLPWPLHREALS